MFVFGNHLHTAKHFYLLSEFIDWFRKLSYYPDEYYSLCEIEDNRITPLYYTIKEHGVVHLSTNDGDRIFKHDYDEKRWLRCGERPESLEGLSIDELVEEVTRHSESDEYRKQAAVMLCKETEKKTLYSQSGGVLGIAEGIRIQYPGEYGVINLLWKVDSHCDALQLLEERLPDVVELKKDSRY